MYFDVDEQNLEKAGSYRLSQVDLVSYASPTGGTESFRQDISNLIQEINIYEHLESKTLSGDLTLIDATNVIATLPLTGYERIEFKLSTPGLGIEKGYDFTSISGYPMYVYKIGNKAQVNPRAQAYTLHFCSIETIKNEQRRISKAFAGSIDEFVLEVCRGDLKTKKNLIIESTKNLTKFVVPRLKPFDSIEMFCENATSKNFKNAGYRFFETSLGFNFKSYENMFTKGNGTPRRALANYLPKVKSVRDSRDNRNILSDLQSMESFKVISQFNTLRNLKTGAYASRMVIHDNFNKTFSENDFDYHLDYADHHHLESDSRGGKRDDNGVLPYFKFEDNKAFSDFAEGSLHFSSNTAKVHNDYELPEQKEIVQQRISQKTALSSIVVEFEVPGFTGINAGDVVNLTLPSYSPNKNPLAKDEDPYLSGRYLISGLRHNIGVMAKKHVMVVECIKDSLNTPYPEEIQDTFTNKETNKGDTYLQYAIDENLG